MRPDRLKLYEFGRRAAALLFPNRCPFCRRVIQSFEYYCPSCIERLWFCDKELSAPKNVSHLYVVCRYVLRARKAVLWLKYGGVVYPADAFAKMMSELLKRRRVSADVLVPVPSSFLSVKSRGFATAELLCGRMSAWLDIPALKAVGAFDSKAEQKTLSPRMRIENAKKSFYIRDNVDLKDKRVILVDDVATTGSTLSAIAEMLLDAGASDVAACVFAAPVYRKELRLGLQRIKTPRRIPFPLRDKN